MRSTDFERLYEEHAASLLAFLVYRTGDRVLAEDLVADAFERVLRSHRRFDPRRSSEKTWLYTIGLNLARDHARRASAAQRALERVQVGTETAAAGLDAVENRELVERALSALSIEEREAVALRYGADLSMAEIAKILGEKLSTIEGRVYRALRKLKDEIS